MHSSSVVIVHSVTSQHRKNGFLLFVITLTVLVSLCITEARPRASMGRLILVSSNRPSRAATDSFPQASSSQYQYQPLPLGQRGGSSRASEFGSGTKSAGSAVQMQISSYQGKGESSKQYRQSSNSYSGGTKSSGGYGSGGQSSSSNYGSSGGGGGGYSSGPIQAAVISRHQVHYYDVPSESEPIKPTTVEVGVSAVPINIILRSASSALNIQQVHDGAQGSYQETQSEDEPHTLKHTVTKPIIQEVYEMITPYRFIKQELQPVQEVIQTIVARESGKNAYGSGDGGNSYASNSGNSYSGGGIGGRGGYQAVEQPQQQYQPQQQQRQPIVQQQQVEEDYQQSATKAVVQQETTTSPTTTIRTSNAGPKYEPQEPLEQSTKFELPSTSAPEVVEQHQQQQVIDQIGQDYIAASSNALLTSVYGAPAFTTPDANPRIRPPAQTDLAAQELTPIDSDLVHQYLPLVFEVMNSMESVRNKPSDGAVASEEESETEK